MRKKLATFAIIYVRVFSAHSVSGLPSDDPLHVDWAPSIIGSRSKSREVVEASRDRLERA